MCRVVWVGGRGRGGAWWLPAGGIRASQGTFSSLDRSLHEKIFSFRISEFRVSDTLNPQKMPSPIFSSPARSAQSYCCHLGRPHLRVRPRHTFC